MLPRHLLARRLAARAPLSLHQSRFLRPAATFHSSPPTSNDLPKSPYRTFVDTLREEIRKNRVLQDNYKQLQGDVDKFQDSEAMKKAREMYERARLTSSIKENPRLKAAADELRKTGVKVSDAVGEAVKAMEESDIMRTISKASSAISSAVATGTEPIRKTEAYKALAETIIDALDDSGSSKHGGYEERDARRARRQARLLKLGKTESFAAARARRVAANHDAGGSVVLHASSATREKWDRLKETNPVLRRLTALRAVFDESENPVVASLRGVTQSIASLFDENENATVTRMLRAQDPTYDPESFSRELREYIVPEVVDAYLSADREALRVWCGEATYSVLWATLEVYLKQGLISDSKVLDIRNVDVVSGKILENDTPVLVVSFATQEILLFRNAKTREVVVGAENRVEQCMYAAVLTRIEEELGNEVTGGWKVVEMARRSARSFL